jgi:hypothetical protein
MKKHKGKNKQMNQHRKSAARPPINFGRVDLKLETTSHPCHEIGKCFGKFSISIDLQCPSASNDDQHTQVGEEMID